jgi:hypothetical protein
VEFRALPALHSRWPGLAGRYEKRIADVLFLGHNEGKKIRIPLAFRGINSGTMFAINIA